MKRNAEGIDRGPLPIGDRDDDPTGHQRTMGPTQLLPKGGIGAIAHHEQRPRRLRRLDHGAEQERRPIEIAEALMSTSFTSEG